MIKVTVVGAGNVGATCADTLASREIANEIVVVDIKEGLAEGKSLDIWEKRRSIIMIPGRWALPMIFQSVKVLMSSSLRPDCRGNPV